MVESHHEQLDLEDFASPHKTYSTVGHKGISKESFAYKLPLSPLFGPQRNWSD